MPIKNIARNTLFGQKPAQYNLLFAIIGDAVKLAWELCTGKKVHYTSHLAAWEFGQRMIPWAARITEILRALGTRPGNFPYRLYKSVDSALASLGGVAENGKVNFRVKPQCCYQNEGYYTLEIDYAPSVRVDDLRKYEANIEDIVAKLGFSNIRIAAKPLRIEVDKPKAPTVDLKSWWGKLNAPIDTMLTIPGVSYAKKGLQPFRLTMQNADAPTFFCGATRSGKTQMGMAMILTLCRFNSPQRMSLYIADPKAMDWLPLNGLPHLARQIITEPEEILQLTRDLLAEMDNRRKLALKGDYSYLEKSVVVYIDELADVYDSLQNGAQKEFETNIKRLNQKAAGMGFVMILATQRAYGLPKPLYENLLNRFVLKTRDASDSAAASGVSGTTCHKLRGFGDCELYPAGVRLQGFFVADPRDKSYIATLKGYVDDIMAIWGKRAEFDAAPGDDEPLVIPDDVLSEFEKSDFDTDFLIAAYEEWGEMGEISERRISAIHRDIVGSELFTQRRKAVKALLENATRGEK